MMTLVKRKIASFWEKLVLQDNFLGNFILLLTSPVE